MARIGNNDNSLSPQAAEAIKAIRSGQTKKQFNRDLLQKSFLIGSEAFLQGAAGTVKGQLANAKENEQKRAVMQRAIANAKQSAGIRADGTHGGESLSGPKDQVGAAGYSPDHNWQMNAAVAQGRGNGVAVDQTGMPEWNNMTGDKPNKFIQGIGKEGIANDDNNAAAASAPVTWGGKPYYTAAGLDDATQNAAIEGQDENTGQSLMKQYGAGGMMNSKGRGF